MPEIASLDDLTVERDSRGNLQAETVEVEELDGAAVQARPLTKAEKREYIAPMMEGEEVPSEVLAEWFDEKIAEPDLTEHDRCPDDGVNAEFVDEELTEGAEDGFFFAILLASGLDEFVNFHRKLYSADFSAEDLAEFDLDPRDMDDDDLRALGLNPERARETYTEMLADDEVGEGN